jgi:hypothetical protein
MDVKMTQNKAGAAVGLVLRHVGKILLDGSTEPDVRMAVRLRS